MSEIVLKVLIAREKKIKIMTKNFYLLITLEKKNFNINMYSKKIYFYNDFQNNAFIKLFDQKSIINVNN
jgi:hypothetical protein